MESMGGMGSCWERRVSRLHPSGWDSAAKFPPSPGQNWCGFCDTLFHFTHLALKQLPRRWE